MITIIYVTSLDGQVEPLINIGTDFRMEQSTDGSFTISLSTFPENNPGYELLKAESIVTVEGNDFRVKQVSQNAYSKSVTAINTFFDLSKKQIHSQLNGVRTLSERLSFVLNGTDWTYTIDSAIASKSVLINSFGKSNVIALIETVCKYYECEYIINGNNVHFAAQIGPDNDYQYRYKHNVSSVVMKEDTTNLYTKIRGYGADGLTVTYTSPNAAVFGELEAEPIEDDRYTNSANLLAYIKQQIVDVPELAIETTIPELTARETGERIWLIYEPLNIEMQTRILKQTKTLRNGELVTSSVVFGNSQIKSSADLFVEQKQEYNELSGVVVKQEQHYNGVEISKEEGVKVSADDVIVWLNATEGILITKNGMQKFYVDTSGNLTFDGRLNITAYGITFLESFMDSYGGRILVNDNNGNLNVKIGSESGTGGNRAGTIILYDDGNTNAHRRVELGIRSNNGAGVIGLRDANGYNRIAIDAGTSQGAALVISNASGANTTYLTESDGFIGGQRIATQSWVINYVSNALANYTPPSSETE